MRRRGGPAAAIALQGRRFGDMVIRHSTRRASPLTLGASSAHDWLCPGRSQRAPDTRDARRPRSQGRAGERRTPRARAARRDELRPRCIPRNTTSSSSRPSRAHHARADADQPRPTAAEASSCRTRGRDHGREGPVRRAQPYDRIRHRHGARSSRRHSDSASAGRKEPPPPPSLDNYRAVACYARSMSTAVHTGRRPEGKETTRTLATKVPARSVWAPTATAVPTLVGSLSDAPESTSGPMLRSSPGVNFAAAALASSHARPAARRTIPRRRVSDRRSAVVRLR
jgi:hypothetical protein